MAWTIRYSQRAAKELRKLDKPSARRMIMALEEISALADPRSRGRGLTGSLAGLWRYRVGDYRIICDLSDDQLVIVALELGHRSAIYD
ncbi:type II toxin-antitoxin system mRNA interferase toxin, RelE/StbE family [Arthrobacter sp. AQ5-05]|nr:type II toxin-antitoxin system mRNA interferase toxin, RelE/StbE family [Arthrobacter sp. AQ5-05]